MFEKMERRVKMVAVPDFDQYDSFGISAYLAYTFGKQYAVIGSRILI